MPVPLAPREIVRNRSSSVGSCPPAVVRNLNWPAVKSRGGGTRNGAPYPSPFPSAPWHCDAVGVVELFARAHRAGGRRRPRRDGRVEERRRQRGARRVPASTNRPAAWPRPSAALPPPLSEGTCVIIASVSGMNRHVGTVRFPESRPYDGRHTHVFFVCSRSPPAASDARGCLWSAARDGARGCGLRRRRLGPRGISRRGISRAASASD